MSQKFYIASCIFTEDFPALSQKIQEYIARRFELPIIRCCVDKYKVEEFEQRMPEWYRPQWQSITHFQKFPRGSMIKCLSLWELSLSDEQFQYPDLGGEPITVQDCWRSKENRAEQNAVRSILRRMNVSIVELEENHERTRFCGYSLYQPQPKRNAKLAPKRFVEGAKGFFEPHSDDEKRRLMVEYCRQIKTPRVVCYSTIACAA